MELLREVKISDDSSLPPLTVATGAAIAAIEGECLSSAKGVLCAKVATPFGTGNTDFLDGVADADQTPPGQIPTAPLAVAMKIGSQKLKRLQDEAHSRVSFKHIVDQALRSHGATDTPVYCPHISFVMGRSILHHKVTITAHSISFVDAAI